MSDKIDEKKINVLKLEMEYLNDKNVELRDDFFIDPGIIPMEWYMFDNNDKKIEVLKEALEKNILIPETEKYEEYFLLKGYMKEEKHMQNTSDKFLPIGTVVMLKEGKKRLMITGFCASQGNDKDQMWDYSGCLYPEGIVDSNQTALFNHDQIETVYYYGLIDEEEKKFKSALNNYIQNGKKQEENTNT